MSNIDLRLVIFPLLWQERLIQDGNELIEIRTLEDLDAIRNALDGRRHKTSRAAMVCL